MKFPENKFQNCAFALWRGEQQPSARNSHESPAHYCSTTAATLRNRRLRRLRSRNLKSTTRTPLKTKHRSIARLALLALATIIHQPSTAHAQLAFSTNTYNVGSQPYSVVAVDVNGDSKPDFICANQSGTLLVLTNNGGGVFGSNATINVSDSALGCVVAADVNGDGKPDLICSEVSYTTLAVLTNNGSGKFSSNATLTVGRTPATILAADINNDGKLDLISANLQDNSLTVLINQTPFSTIPVLNIASFGNQVAITWPAWAANRILQSTMNLSSTNWVTVTNGAPIVGVMLTNSSPTRFFRLR
jgi:hypothetical protein